MDRAGLAHIVAVASLLGTSGCAQVVHWSDSARVRDERAVAAVFRPRVEETRPAEIASVEGWDGPRPVEVFIGRALAENRTVRAAFHNVKSLQQRIPQAVALEDPVASSTIFPIPSVAPQYSLMGYNPYNLTLAQQFPWYGTLRLRGEAANRDVKVALAELAAAQLDAVAAVKRGYFDLYAGQRTAAILAENRALLEEFRDLARSRLAAGGSRTDAIRSEVLLSELDREIAANRSAIVTARSGLARQLHLSPETPLQALDEARIGAVPAETGRLHDMAIAARPELRGRLAAIARDETAVALARKRSMPNVTLGVTYMDMEKTNAETPRTASGMPNLGLVVGFNLPINRAKYRAGVCEARERTEADARLYEAQRDETFAEVADSLAQSRAQGESLTLLRDEIRPRSRETLDLARGDYARSTVDYPTVLAALRESLQVELQIVIAEAELGKALASLERAVGGRINDPAAIAPDPAPPPPPAEGAGPFGSR